MPTSRELITQRRDAKVHAAMSELAPVWLINEDFKPREDALIFSLVFNDPSYGWMSRRYKYDGFNDVLYHMGWRLLSEAEVLSLTEGTPYLEGDVAVHVPNAPGYRVGSGVAKPK